MYDGDCFEINESLSWNTFFETYYSETDFCNGSSDFCRSMRSFLLIITSSLNSIFFFKGAHHQGKLGNEEINATTYMSCPAHGIDLMKSLPCDLVDKKLKLYFPVLESLTSPWSS